MMELEGSVALVMKMESVAGVMQMELHCGNGVKMSIMTLVMKM